MQLTNLNQIEETEDDAAGKNLSPVENRQGQISPNGKTLVHPMLQTSKRQSMLIFSKVPLSKNKNKVGRSEKRRNRQDGSKLRA